MNKGQITKDMTIDEILSSFPSKTSLIAQELVNTGLQCVGCGAATWETLEAGMLGHGMDTSQIEALVVKLNQILAQKDPQKGTISITERAAEKFKSLLKESKKEGYGLRFGDKPGGCGGFEYILDFSEKPKETDQVFTCFGVDIHVCKSSVERLLGSEIDYLEGLTNSGFKVVNPNVKHSCSCGNSQSY